MVRRHGKLIDVSFEPLPTSTTPTNGNGTQEIAGNKALLLLQRYKVIIIFFMGSLFSVSNLDGLLGELNHTVMAGSKLKATRANHVAVTEAHNAYLAATSATASGAAIQPYNPPPLSAAVGSNERSGSLQKSSSLRDFKGCSRH